MPELQFQCRHVFPSGFVLAAEFCAAGGITALVGPSGSGKSTTLGIIAGIVRPQQGLVTLNSQVLIDTQRQIHVPPERRQIGCVFQDYRLFPHLTVGDNLRYGLRRRPARQVDEKLVIEMLELGDLLQRTPRSLSGGQQQRTALGRALLRGPELLLMDEPLTGLDDDLKGRILDYLERAIAEWHIPTVVVSHNLADVRRLANSVVTLEAGQVVLK